MGDKVTPTWTLWSLVSETLSRNNTANTTNDFEIQILFPPRKIENSECQLLESSCRRRWLFPFHQCSFNQCTINRRNETYMTTQDQFWNFFGEKLYVCQSQARWIFLLPSATTQQTNTTYPKAIAKDLWLNQSLVPIQNFRSHLFVNARNDWIQATMNTVLILLDHGNEWNKKKISNHFRTLICVLNCRFHGQRKNGQ